MNPARTRRLALFLALSGALLGGCASYDELVGDLSTIPEIEDDSSWVPTEAWEVVWEGETERWAKRARRLERKTMRRMRKLDDPDEAARYSDLASGAGMLKRAALEVLEAPGDTANRARQRDRLISRYTWVERAAEDAGLIEPGQ